MRLLLLVVAFAGLAFVDELPELKTARPPLRTEPAYVAAPLYGVALFGPRAEKAMWMVLDKSDAAAEIYDVLYLDVNGDGDLTDPAERRTLEKDRRFRVVDFTDLTGVRHGEFTVRP